MTLIFTLATPRYILQVSDRLVTRDERQFDPASNKTLIYHAKNAVVSIGYSGLAYLEDVPTDQWIAQKLWGEGRFLELEPGRPAAFTYGRAPQWLDIGRSMDLLRHECEQVFSGLPPHMLRPQHIVLAGWQWRRGVVRPIVCQLRNSERRSGLRTFEASDLPRYWHWQKGNPLYLCWIPHGGLFSRREIRDLADQLRKTWWSPQTSQGLLVDAIHLAARKSSVVGRDCMSVFMPPLGSRIVEVSYRSPQQARAVVTEGEKRLEFPAAFTPWIVGPRCVVAPSIVTSSWTLGLGPVTVFIQGPDISPESGHVAAWSSQIRPPDPLGTRPHEMNDPGDQGVARE